jgi:signal recognition particle subunit SRP54
VILMAGLQGSGKTTACGKLARHLKEEKGLDVALAACDLQRPAAVDQLIKVGERAGAAVYEQGTGRDPVDVAEWALGRARADRRDMLIVDTAGRLHVDGELMDQLAQVKKRTKPHDVLLVLDAMTGQDAVATAKAFDERLELDGVILTKFDSDTRGGAALSVKSVTGKPIKFIGVGEKLDAIEEFHPERIASRILGMGDVVSLVEKAQQVYDAKDAEKLQERMASGKFGFDDFLTQLESFRKMGPMKQILKLIPGLGAAMKDMEMPEEELDQFRGIVHSMTQRERENPDIIEASRRRRIARGAGVEQADVSGLVKQFLQMRPMMKQMAGMGMGQRMKMAQSLGQGGMLDGRMPRVKKGTTRYNPRKPDRKKRRRR